MMALNLGLSPASSMKMPAMASTERLITLVMATMPTFWLKVEVGSAANSALTAVVRPLPSRPPVSSRVFSSRFMPATLVAERSPMVCTELITQITTMETIAAEWNSSSKGMNRGTASQLASATAPKSTMPMGRATA